MADERLRTKRELKRLFTNLKRKGITDDMMSIAIDTLWRDRVNQRSSGFFHAGGFDAEFSFDINTRIFLIKPFDPLVENFEPRYSVFSWSNEAVPHRIFTPHQIEIPNEEGLFCIYFDKEPNPGRNQILYYKKNPTIQELELIYVSKILISCFYWDAANNELLHFGDDRHGSEWNPQIHWYVHTTLGAQRKSGLQFSGYSLNGDGSLNDHAKFSITGGVMLHDDFELEIPASSNSIPVLYSFGNYPRFLTNNGYAFAGATRVYYNSGRISLEQADSGNFVLYHIFATNEILTESRKIVSVMGTAQYTTLADAYMGVNTELDGIVTYMPQQGKCYLGSIIVQTSDDFTNSQKAIIVALTGHESHPPVTIAPGSKQYLGINDKQELSIYVDNLPGGETTTYDWNIHSPEQIIGYVAEPVNIIATIDGTGTPVTTIPAGTYAITALNENGETLPVNVPEIVILDDSTSPVVTWDIVDGAISYRVYNVAGEVCFELALNTWNYLTEIPATAGTLPMANTAAIYQSAFTIANGDTVEFAGEGIDVETEVDETDSTLKKVLLKKQRSNWNSAVGPNVIENKPTIPEAQIQSDWNQINNTVADYIKNKPQIPTPYYLPAATASTIGGVLAVAKPFQMLIAKDITPGTAQEYDLILKAQETLVINSIVVFTDNGTLTGCELKINGTAVTLTGPVTTFSITTTLTEIAAISGKNIAAGENVTINTTTGYTVTPTTIKVQLNYSKA
jgi:hypothetical protein